MDLDNLTIGEAREISKLFNMSSKNPNYLDYKGPWEIGKRYFIRTVTMHLTGELIAIHPSELVLKDAAWVADSGRLNEFLADIENCNEAEPFNDIVFVGRGSIVDATIIQNIITTVK